MIGLLVRFSWGARWNLGIAARFREKAADTRPMRTVRSAVLLILGLAALGLGWHLSTARAFRARLADLVALSVPPSPVRRPWEPRLEALEARLVADPGFPPEGPRPTAAWREAPRDLDAQEQQWVTEAGAALEGLESVLVALRRLEPDALGWNGSTVRLLFARACTNVLLGQAWSDRDEARLIDALRLTRAVDDGTTMGSLIRTASEGMLLDCVQAGVADGRFRAQELLEGVRPLLDDWAHEPERTARRLRRDLAEVARLARVERVEQASWLARPVRQRQVLQLLAPIEKALEIAQLPAARSPWVLRGELAALLDREAEGSSLSVWCNATADAHRRHASRNVLLIGLAVAAVREERGRWPERLEEVAGLEAEDVLDPVTAGPLPFSVNEEGVTIGPACWGLIGDPRLDPFRAPYGWRMGREVLPTGRSGR
jgi:hypothetical protein